MKDQIFAFIEQLRGGARTETGNIFAMSASVWIRYYGFLQVIKAEYHTLSKQYITGSEDRMALHQKKGSGIVTPEEFQRMNELMDIGQQLQLRIESFYIFSKLLLDRIADTLAYLFEFKYSDRGSTHVELAKIFKDTVLSKALKLEPTSLPDQIISLKEDVITYRNNEIEHTKEPRLIRGMTWDRGQKEVRISPNIIYPKDGEAEGYFVKQTKTPNEILELVDPYIASIMTFIITNKDKALLK